MRKGFSILLLTIFCFINYSDARGSGGSSRIRSPTNKRYFGTSIASYRNRVFRCYSCDDSHLCAINPTVYAKAVICPKGELCSIVRTEITEVANYTKLDEVKSSGTKTAGTLSKSTSLSSEVSIWRGCQSLVPVKLTQNLLSFSVHHYFCAKDLCNHGDGNLRCYECNGVGINDRCMVSPSAVAKQVICGPSEACYVERSVMDDDSVALSNDRHLVSRGCIASDVVGLLKYRSNDSITVLCRIGDLCNRMDARTIVVDSTSELRSSLTSLGLAFILTLLLCF